MNAENIVVEVECVSSDGGDAIGIELRGGGADSHQPCAYTDDYDANPIHCGYVSQKKTLEEFETGCKGSIFF